MEEGGPQHLETVNKISGPRKGAVEISRIKLDTDASAYAIGAVLSQVQDGKARVIDYGSRCLDNPERNYCVTRREMLAVVYFTKYFKQFLLGRVFKLRTDHGSLI